MPEKHVSSFLLLCTLLFFSGPVLGKSSMGYYPSEDKRLPAWKTGVKPAEGAGLALIEGELKQYHKLTLTWEGPALSESETTFRNYRLNVIFTAPSGKIYRVPGYFAADGNAAETSAVSGNKWRCHFLALETGLWQYETTFRTGDEVALSTEDEAGSAIAPIDGDQGNFTIDMTDKSGKDFRSKGKLEYVGEHFMQWSTGEYFMKIGSNSPENLFEYGGFDDSNSTRTFPDHIADWTLVDPTWKGGEGKGIIGAINYLSIKGVNSQYFVLHRKEENATPWVDPAASYFNYDVSKMDQWQLVFDHMMEKGVMAHIVFSESQIQSIFEVESPSDDPSFSDARKLYFREVLARFGYLNAVTWNIGEENGWDRRSATIGEEGRPLTTAQQREFAAYIDGLAYYNDFITIHNGPSHDVRIFDRLLGQNSLTGISMQGFFGNVVRSKGSTENYREESTNSGKKWVVYYDEAFEFGSLDIDRFRKNVLWSTLTAGGAGMEHYATEGKDVTLEDFRFYDAFFTQMRHAYDFYHDHAIPFHSMYNQDHLVSNGWCHGTESSVYVIYMTADQLGNTTIDLSSSYTIAWFNPREGGDLVEGTVARLEAGDAVHIGAPSISDDGDWVALLQNTDAGTNAVTGVEIVPDRLTIVLGQQEQLSVAIIPATASNTQVEWSSSDDTLVTVDSNGMISGEALGMATITVTTDDGAFSAEAQIEVIDDSAISVTGVTLLPEAVALGLGETQTLDASVQPMDATNTTVFWSATPPSVVAVDTQGEVLALAEGEAVVRVVTEDGNFAAETLVTVTDKGGIVIAGISVEPATAILEVGETLALELSIHPPNATDQEVVWSSGNPTVASVNASGEVVGLSVGTTDINVISADGNFDARTTVSVIDGLPEEPIVIAVTGLEVEVTQLTVFEQDKVDIAATVLPENASNKDIIWVSENTRVATVDAIGSITAQGRGETLIRATTADGGFSQTIRVQVLPKAIKAFPNPAKDFLHITGIDEQVNVFIHHANGSLLRSTRGGKPIYIGDLSSSNYIIRLSTGERIHFIKR